MPGVHRRFVVRVAIQASENAIVRNIGMAVRAGIPLTFVSATVYGEKLTVMIKSSRFPGVGVVASLAIFRKTGTGVIRARGGIVGSKMAGNALFG